jgi:hypothetical protein
VATGEADGAEGDVLLRGGRKKSREDTGAAGSPAADAADADTADPNAEPTVATADDADAAAGPKAPVRTPQSLFAMCTV